eukprot:gnl/MRDRNA2_/MRDRNA2_24302_c0_seq1.p1 gnl/MRDRNA2_/MRDRNA2_24302_c0~~gnl/MRDRNA2_/MRDRNA2_24302_c0_seq1.p1  ORF type:complete len:170 (+),score=35.74 gnl/MRDRNA2_/MRDRNA2_24302_c0_seq1:58-510(+)
MCPPSTAGKVQKMAIPLEYASYNALEDKMKPGSGLSGKNEPIEKILDMEHDEQKQYLEAQEVPAVTRLLLYRRGLLYMKYRCPIHLKHEQNKLVNSGSTIMEEGNVARILKISLMLQYEPKSPTDVRKNDRVVESYALNDKAPPFTESSP